MTDYSYYTCCIRLIIMGAYMPSKAMYDGDKIRPIVWC